MIKCHSLFFSIAVILQLILICQAYMYLQPVKFGDGECFDDDFNVHPIGSTWYDSEKCERMKCIFSGDILYIQVYGCSAIGYPQDCWLVHGKGKNYPKCCPQVECMNLGIMQN
ncbi:hypothetical protein JTE90_001660 [Oedothorax gibbosus]|uniref:Single domain-containing protein n=1 Tax=Oedothorax gibbosus TaxID=931172 RepID=A0AAV6UTZ5_9ARAC|nr:hypothetical protein JTE90_001660 [Oedothorax gibbosus]